MGKAATEAKLSEERSLVFSRNNVSRETLARLDAYVDVLRQWQARINLIAPSTVPEIWTRHVEDGLWLEKVARPRHRWVDIGSGAGLPGLILAIFAAERPESHVHLIEANAKKAAFLRTVVRELELPATVHGERIEACSAVLAQAEAISARALASLDELLRLVGPHLSSEAVCYFPKGRTHEAEIVDASAHWHFDMVKHPSTSEADSVILELRNCRMRNPVAGI